MPDSTGFQVFRFKDASPVRIADRDGAPWFVAADVCKALKLVNPRKAVTQLDDDECMTVTFSDGQSNIRGGARKLNIISESGLYALIIRSSKPAAREFRKWITAEVLPAIRKNGAYALPGLPALSDPEDDPAKRTTAELVEQTNRRLAAGENIPPHVLRYVAEVARIASGVWYRDSFGVDGRARKILPGIPGILLPELTVEENRAAKRIMDIVRKRGRCNARGIAQHCGAMGGNAARRRKVITALVNAGLLQCSGLPGQRGETFWI